MCEQKIRQDFHQNPHQTRARLGGFGNGQLFIFRVTLTQIGKKLIMNSVNILENQEVEHLYMRIIPTIIVNLSLTWAEIRKN